MLILIKKVNLLKISNLPIHLLCQISLNLFELSTLTFESILALTNLHIIGFLLINRPIFLVVVSDLKWIEMQNWKMSPGKFIHDKTRPNCLLKMVLVACTISVQKSISCVLSIHHFTYFYCTSQYKVQHIVLLFLYEFFNFQFCDFLVNMGVDDKNCSL